MAQILTLVAGPATRLTPALLARVRDAVSAGAPVSLSDGEAADLPCPAPPDRALIAAALDGAPVDWAVLPAEHRRKRLLIADMDSTIVTGETLDELAAQAGVGEQVAAITRESMEGKLDFAQALRARVAMLRGLPLAALERTWEGVRLSPGARTLVATMRAHGARAVLVSGGFTFFTGRIAALCGFDAHQANLLLDDGTALTGAVAEPILDRDAKLTALRRWAGDLGLSHRDTLAVGDGANDLAMIQEAGLGIAYRAKPVVAAAAGARVDHADLRALLYFQGYSASVFRDG
ncbi:MAG: phosphoserine phosphatase SerB [Acetobacteraceae bacterium]|nr:phosphoserine phosphatase SerB [Acetobacteraceae bacterium]